MIEDFSPELVIGIHIIVAFIPMGDGRHSVGVQSPKIWLVRGLVKFVPAVV